MRRVFIHVATITHRHGVDVKWAMSKSGLTNILYGWACDYWNEGPGAQGEVRPKSKQKAIDQYFDHAADGCESESYQTDIIDTTSVIKRDRMQCLRKIQELVSKLKVYDTEVVRAVESVLKN